jgi:zinc D-Ala-D-Ala dipeptidase
LYYALGVRRWLWIAVCVRVAAAAPPPSDADLIDVAPAIPDAVFDLRYATEHNFTGKPLYAVARCELRRAVVAQLVRAAKTLRADGRRLLIWDCYRPASVQAELWKRVHDPRYVADPKLGSRHSRGDAVDLGLVDLDGHAVALPTDFDDFTAAAHRDRENLEARRLEAAMTAAGFVGLATEWWHFDAGTATKYPIADDPL